MLNTKARPDSPALKRALALLLFSGLCHGLLATGAVGDFNAGWRFIRSDAPGAEQPGFNDRSWDEVGLPHTARVEALVTGGEDSQWQGICWYRKTFALGADATNKLVLLRFEGAMNTAEVWVNGARTGRFMGGYLPYVMDISDRVNPGGRNVIAVRLDNRDNPMTGPKPLKDLDFNLYSGIYRPAQLVVKDRLHITDPMLETKTASGGVFVTFPEATTESAAVRIQTHARNSHETERSATLRTTLLDPQGAVVARAESGPERLAAGADKEWVQLIRVPDPHLWSPQSPELYTVRSELMGGDRVIDSVITRVGIRRIRITQEGLWINGQRQFLRGANRHQEYPYIGNALSDAAQYRDALKIKQAGFDYVRLSHYPQSPAFMDACDELGLVVMNCLMGWQYFNKDPDFAELKYEECRQLVRRDRNHPCVILWEVSLNESHMPKQFIQRTQAIAHEECPGDQCYTCGWMDGYDVFIQARQHGGCVGITNKPCVVSEYGDWEYYAQNAGLHQHLWNDLQPSARSSRQLRGDGDVRLLQQALNFQEAHNDNLKTTAFADGIWVMYDYNRGYADDIEASGVMDIFRLPKFGYEFFRSQRTPDELVAGEPAGPMIFIANHWTPDSPLSVRIFSNCDEVELRLNGHPVERRTPDQDRVSSHIKHPPFTFTLERFEPGLLTAIGFIDGQRVCTHERRTPAEPERLVVRFDVGPRPFGALGKDAIFCYVDLLDAAGTVVPNAPLPVSVGVIGGAYFVGGNPMLAEAGTATRLLMCDEPRPDAHVYALCLAPTEQGVRMISTSGSTGQMEAPPHEIHYTTDGSRPALDSPQYREPVQTTPNLRAGMFVWGELITEVELKAAAVSTGFSPVRAKDHP